MTLPLGQRWLTGSNKTVPECTAESKGFASPADENPLTSARKSLLPRRSRDRRGTPDQDSWMVTDVIATGSSGRSRAFRGALTICSTTSIPRVTTPNNV
jgi:hypothetical protein